MTRSTGTDSDEIDDPRLLAGQHRIGRGQDHGVAQRGGEVARLGHDADEFAAAGLARTIRRWPSMTMSGSGIAANTASAAASAVSARWLRSRQPRARRNTACHSISAVWPRWPSRRVAAASAPGPLGSADRLDRFGQQPPAERANGATAIASSTSNDGDGDQGRGQIEAARRVEPGEHHRARQREAERKERHPA